MKHTEIIQLKNIDATVKPKVAFVCNHNSCRSQMAEALGKKYGAEVFDSYSAGTIIKNHINPDAVRLIKEIYGIDMEETQFNKTVDDIPEPDIVIFMGCDVGCPILDYQHGEDWGLDDPSGKADPEFKTIINTIEENILALKDRIKK